MKTMRYFLSYLAHFFLERETFRTEVVGEIKHTFCLYTNYQLDALIIIYS